MTEPHKTSGPGPSLEIVLRRQEYAKLMVDSHIRWLNQSDDQELRLIHRALIDSFQTVIEQYSVLLDVLERGGEK